MKSLETLDSVGERIRKIRKDNKLSQKSFGKICGVSQLTLLRYETNYRGPDMKFLLKMSENFNVNINWVLRNLGESYFSDSPKESSRVYIELEDLKEAFREFTAFLKASGGARPGKQGALRADEKNRKNRNVLLLSDQRKIQDRVCEPLSQASYEVLVAETPKEAAKIMASKKFQLLVVDLNPGSAETLGFLDKLNRFDRPAVLLLTETDQLEKVFDMLETLEADYLDRTRLDQRELVLRSERLLRYARTQAAGQS